MEQLDGWGWPGVAAQVHFRRFLNARRAAGDGRESPLKYTCWQLHRLPHRLGVAGSRRSSTLLLCCVLAVLPAGDGRESPLKYTCLICVHPQQRLGMAGSRRSSTLQSESTSLWSPLGMAGSRRSSTLPALTLASEWSLGMAGSRRSSTLTFRHGR